jgi:hypothetical protein
MGGQLTWYDILDVLPGATADEVQRAFEAKEAVLSPKLISGALPRVVTAARRAQTAIEAARHVLTDPASRRRYDEAAGIRRLGGGLSGPELVWPDVRWAEDLGMFGKGALLAGALEALADWLAPRAEAPRRIEIPDVRGLFVRPCRLLIGGIGLRADLVRLTQDPMPVEGLVVDQSPPPGATVRRSGSVTIQVWHPPQRR